MSRLSTDNDTRNVKIELEFWKQNSQEGINRAMERPFRMLTNTFIEMLTNTFANLE